MKKTFWWGLGFLIVIGLIFYSSLKPGKYDDFARCLTENGVKMYGAYWCSHCQEQKALFGKSWEYVDYIECATPGSKTPKVECIAAGVKGYPMWSFGADRKISGALAFEQLASFSGCELPQD